MTSGLLAISAAAPFLSPSEFSRGGEIPPALRALPRAEIPFRVLLLEPENSVDTLLADVMQAELPEADIVPTAGALGALALASLHAFDLLVVDFPLQVDLRIELLESFMGRNPGAEIILTGSDAASAGHRGPRVHVLAQPVNPLELLELARECRERRKDPKLSGQAEEPEDHGRVDHEEHVDEHFTVVLNRHSPIEVVQFKCLSGATTALDFVRRNGPGGCIWFDRGEIVHAETGSLRGEAALYEMMSWPGGSIVEVVAPRPLERTIFTPCQSLLMVAAHSADERRAQLLSA